MSEAREAKLKGELESFKNAIQELEARITKKGEVIAKEHAQVAELKTKLGYAKSKTLVLET